MKYPLFIVETKTCVDLYYSVGDVERQLESWFAEHDIILPASYFK